MAQTTNPLPLMATASDRYAAGRAAYNNGQSIQSLSLNSMWSIDCLYGFMDAMADDVRKIKTTAKG